MRLSAIGDVCHALPVIRTLQAAWPECKFTWIIGKVEHMLIGDIPEIEFIVFDKSKGWGAIKALRHHMKGKKFDLMLHMQTSLRSNIAAWFVPAKIKLGYDKHRAKELHGWVTTHTIGSANKQHQIDDMFDFAKALGIESRLLKWDIPIPQSAVDFSNTTLSNEKPVLAINACSSPSKRVHRNWSTDGYARVAEHAVNHLGYQVVLCGGPTLHEIQAAKEVEEKAQCEILNLVGKTSLKQLLAVLDRAAVLLTSDSGPAHIATALGTPVIALHAVTNPFQTGPYLSLDKVINKYPEAVQDEYGKPLEELSWGIRVHKEDAMNRISAEKVIEQLEKIDIKTKDK